MTVTFRENCRVIQHPYTRDEQIGVFQDSLRHMDKVNEEVPDMRVGDDR